MASAVAASQNANSNRGFPVKLQEKVLAPHPPRSPKHGLGIDPQRALEPTRKKLSTIEAQRVITALQDSIKKTELLTALPYLLENVERYRIVLGTDLCNLLESHKVIIQSFEELKLSAEKILERESKEQAEEHSSDNADRPTSAESAENQADVALRSLTMVARQMQFSCKNIIRAFAVNPTAINAVIPDAAAERAEHSEYLISEMNQLKEIVMGKLLTTPYEEKQRTHYLKQVSEQERISAGIITKLDAEVRVALEEKEEEVMSLFLFCFCQTCNAKT